MKLTDKLLREIENIYTSDENFFEEMRGNRPVRDEAYIRFAKTLEDEEIFNATSAETFHLGFVHGFKCAMLLVTGGGTL